MIATAIGPKKSERVSGIIARIAASAVSAIGRSRRTVASITALKGSCPAAISFSIWSIKITELRMIMPNSAMVPNVATKPKGLLKIIRKGATPMRPSGAVSSTRITR